MTDDELRQAVLKIDLLLKRRQAMWEISKGIAALAAAGAVFLGFVLAASNWLHPSPQQITATIHS
ncbi:MAG: hypothetical protein J2P37_36445 [Ktedonobacteraceae bacterium]|nr:hypothetical protein [Ktedonobacteraceae bacterium]